MRGAMQVYPVVLQGTKLRLEPLSESHLSDLALVGLDERIWRLMLYGDIQTKDQLHLWILEMLRRQARGTDVPFAVIFIDAGRAIGATRFMNISPQDRGLEIGGTWYGTAYQGTGVNAEAKYLLLKHAFETLGCIRVQLKTDSRNERSQHAIEKLGAVKEGVLRKHMILPDGTVRDSVIYSIIDLEWPVVKARLEKRLGISSK